MFLTISSLVLVISTFTCFGYAQREIEKEEIKKVEKAPAPPPRREAPKGPRVAQKRTNGVLFVLTEPLTAHVVIKNSRGQISKQDESDNGELRAELAQGSYSIEVSADKYYPHAEPKVFVSPSQPKTVRAYLKPTTGSIIIGLGQVEPDAAKILIDEQQPSNLKVKVNIKKEENQIELEDVPEGIHTLSITNPNIADWKREKVQVGGGEKITIAPRFQMAVVNFIVRSQPGANIYVDGRIEGRVEPNGELKIPGKYKPGHHTVKAENERERFEPAEKTDDFPIGDATVELKLNRIKSSPEFADSFNAGLSLWDAPRTWQVSHGKLSVKASSEVGLVRNNQVWDDFKMEFDISFTNGRGAAWIIRARDKKDYYLFQLSGPEGANPRVFRSYVYQKGQPTLLKSDSVVEDLSRPKDQYHITIEVRGATIKHFITVSSNPSATSELMSTLTDSTFSYGTIGFGAIDGEEFAVYFVNVTPGESKSR